MLGQRDGSFVMLFLGGCCLMDETLYACSICLPLSVYLPLSSLAPPYPSALLFLFYFIQYNARHPVHLFKSRAMGIPSPGHRCSCGGGVHTHIKHIVHLHRFSTRSQTPKIS
ncbi:hypothetical protein CH63R_13661 [Colletotrichum higginsianum IMI 349063]|nr:hypothetical protein CH63R_13661 [Colletotrichum higginsianum IMI 349063]OBR02435.1 hypothetical protein CH63R_13661 [Colletotrichum higginsianum IMI 349063]